MDVADFAEWVAGTATLTPSQRREAFRSLALAEAMAGLDVEACEYWGCEIEAAVTDRNSTIMSELEGSVEPPAPPNPSRSGLDSVAEVGRRRVVGMGCPHCANRDVILWGKANGLPRYRCRGCGRTFNGLTKTPLARLRKREKWREQAQSMIDGVTTSKAAERCEVDYKTAFRWRHRFLKSLSSDKPKTLSGIVEGDETFILESFKGKRSDLPRKARKRGGKAAKRGLSAEQIPVIVARDRAGATIDAVLPKLDRASITGALGGVVTPANQFCCDGGRAIVAFAKKAGIPHHVLPAPGKPSPDAQTSTSIMSMPTMAGSKNGCAASMASRPRICRTISAGAERSKRSGRRSNRRTGSSAPLAWGLTNSKRHKSHSFLSLLFASRREQVGLRQRGLGRGRGRLAVRAVFRLQASEGIELALACRVGLAHAENVDHVRSPQSPLDGALDIAECVSRIAVAGPTSVWSRKTTLSASRSKNTE